MIGPARVKNGAIPEAGASMQAMQIELPYEARAERAKRLAKMIRSDLRFGISGLEPRVRAVSRRIPRSEIRRQDSALTPPIHLPATGDP
jgi:hypothetical protein